MNRLSISLLIALSLSTVTGVTVIILQQRTISALREENEQQARTAGTPGGIPGGDFPGRYRWFQDGVERGFITLNPDNTAVGLSGKKGFRGTSYRWFYQGGQIALTWGTTHALLTESNGPGNYSGKEGSKSVQMIREP